MPKISYHNFPQDFIGQISFICFYMAYVVACVPFLLSTGAVLVGCNPFVILFDTFYSSGGSQGPSLRIFLQVAGTLVVTVGSAEGVRVGVLFLIFILFPAALAFRALIQMHVLLQKSLQNPLHKHFLHKYYQVKLVLMKIQYDFVLPASYFLQLIGKWIIVILFLLSIRLESTNFLLRLFKIGAGFFSAFLLGFAFVTLTAASEIARKSDSLIRKWRSSLHPRDAFWIKMSRARRVIKVPCGLFGFYFYGFDRGQVTAYINGILDLIVDLLIYFG